MYMRIIAIDISETICRTDVLYTPSIEESVPSLKAQRPLMKSYGL